LTVYRLASNLKHVLKTLVIFHVNFARLHFVNSIVEDVTRFPVE